MATEKSCANCYTPGCGQCGSGLDHVCTDHMTYNQFRSFSDRHYLDDVPDYDEHRQK